MDFPKMIRLKQNFEAPTLEDISGEVNTQIDFEQAIIATGSEPIKLPFMPDSGGGLQ